MTAYLKKPNVHTLVQLRGLLNQGKLSVNDQRLMAIYERLVRGKRRPDAARVIRAVEVVLTRHGVTEGTIAQAASEQRQRLGQRQPSDAPLKHAVQPSSQRKEMLAVLQRAHASLPPQEQDAVTQYVDALGGRVRVTPEQFNALERAALSVYYSIAGEVREESSQFAEQFRDTAVDETPLQKLHTLGENVTLLGDENDIAYVQGLLMSEEMGLLGIDAAAAERIDKLYSRMSQSQIA